MLAANSLTTPAKLLSTTPSYYRQPIGTPSDIYSGNSGLIGLRSLSENFLSRKIPDTGGIVISVTIISVLASR
jgi:hypothetical protein